MANRKSHLELTVKSTNHHFTVRLEIQHKNIKTLFYQYFRPLKLEECIFFFYFILWQGPNLHANNFQEPSQFIKTFYTILLLLRIPNMTY
jgi:hypothetical protein